MNTFEASDLAMPTLSVVIPCFNEELYVGDLLGDLRDQTEAPHSVMLADCHSEDRTQQVAEEFADTLNLQIVESPVRSPAAARNIAARALDIRSQDYAIFVDADMRLPKDFLELAGKIIDQHNVDFMTPTFLSDGHSMIDSLLIKRINIYNQRMIKQGRAAGIGGAMIVRKAVHDAVGGFPEDIVKDDMGYLERINELGATAYYAANLRAINSSRRVHQDGVLKLTLGFLPENSYSARLVNRLMRQDVHGRKYGHYHKIGS